MIDKCINWIKRSAKLADEYYRAMTAWTTSRKTDGNIKKLITLASSYERALDKAMACLRRQDRTESVEKEIEKTQDYKALVIADLELLTGMEKRS